MEFNWDAAYGWPADLAEYGLVRWLRPDYQSPLLTGRAVQRQFAMEQAATAETRPWPKRAPE